MLGRIQLQQRVYYAPWPRMLVSARRDNFCCNKSILHQAIHQSCCLAPPAWQKESYSYMHPISMLCGAAQLPTSLCWPARHLEGAAGRPPAPARPPPQLLPPAFSCAYISSTCAL